MSGLEIISGVFLLAGCAFGIVGAVGVLRFPDIFSRMHPAGISDTLCAALVLIGLMLLASEAIVVIKLFLILFFLFFTSPTATHALATTAAQGGCALPAAPQPTTTSKPGATEKGD